MLEKEDSFLPQRSPEHAQMAECILLLESRWEGACKYVSALQCLLLTLALEPRALHMADKCSTK